MIGIVLASHGDFADALLNTSKLFFAEQEQLVSVGLGEEDDINEFEGRLVEAVRSVDTGDGVFVLVDLIFASPCNAIMKHLETENVEVITGLNLPMLLELLGLRDAENPDVDEMVQVGQMGISNLRSKLAEMMSDDQ